MPPPASAGGPAAGTRAGGVAGFAVPPQPRVLPQPGGPPPAGDGGAATGGRVAGPGVPPRPAGPPRVAAAAPDSYRTPPYGGPGPFAYAPLVSRPGPWPPPWPGPAPACTVHPRPGSRDGKLGAPDPKVGGGWLTAAILMALVSGVLGGVVGARIQRDSEPPAPPTLPQAPDWGSRHDSKVGSYRSGGAVKFTLDRAGEPHTVTLTLAGAQD